MKVIFILPNMGAGGAERVVTILAKALTQNGTAVDIVMLFSEKVLCQIPEKVNLISLKTADMSPVSRFNKIREYFVKQKREHKTVVVVPFQHNCLKYSLMAAIGLNIRVVACERNDPYQKGTTFRKRTAANIPYILADKCVFQTPDAMAYYFPSVRRKGKVIENPLILPNELVWCGQESNRIVTVGRLEPQKNQKMLVEAFCAFHKLHPEYILEIYGEGSLREKLQGQIDSCGLSNVIFLRGHSSEVHAKLSQSRLFILPSDYEGMSNALIEAMAIGVPTISTDHPIGGARMLIEDEKNGLLTPVGDSVALCHAMDKLIRFPDYAETLGKNGISIRNRLDAETIASQWMALFR